MELNSLTAISPVDGRYRKITESLAGYFSEFAFFKFRVQVEIEYFISLSHLSLKGFPPVSSENEIKLKSIYKGFSIEDANKIKAFERTTNHDVKAVEYFIKEKVIAIGLESSSEFIHFGLTSQDINNTAIPLMLKSAMDEVINPIILEAKEKLDNMAGAWKDIPMLARTHGQPASPTVLGKEMKVFVERLEQQFNQFSHIPYSGKFGGATGNFNAHFVAYPHIDWAAFANKFLSDLGLARSQYTTQIEHYDNLAAMLDCLKRISTILIDLNRDLWIYISMDYFKQKIREGEIGSSAMPHKVNPIDFENSEGNLGIAIALFEQMAAKLPLSRLQRDLTDSTVLRNLGVPFAHFLISLKSLLKGLDKLILNEKKITGDLDKNWAVVAEAIQTILRAEGFPKPYETLKDLTRKNEEVTEETIKVFIEGLNVEESVKSRLKKITPFNYRGIF